MTFAPVNLFTPWLAYWAAALALVVGGILLAAIGDVSDAQKDRSRGPLPDPGDASTWPLPRHPSSDLVIYRAKGEPHQILTLVSNALRAASAGLSASEVAGVVGTSRVTARRYLEHLAAAGVAERRMRHGGTGRPEVGYRWAR